MEQIKENQLEVEGCSVTNIQFKKILHSKRGKLMVAPCNHVFHCECLLQWMEVKMKCPYCRLNLPQIDY